jgi:hypothetical protein
MLQMCHSKFSDHSHVGLSSNEGPDVQQTETVLVAKDIFLTARTFWSLTGTKSGAEPIYSKFHASNSGRSVLL